MSKKTIAIVGDSREIAHKNIGTVSHGKTTLNAATIEQDIRVYVDTNGKELFLLQSDVTDEVKKLLEEKGFVLSDKLVTKDDIAPKTKSINEWEKEIIEYKFENQHLEHYPPLTNKQLLQTIESIRTEKKVGRNETCICGSGKKFKKCCLGI